MSTLITGGTGFIGRYVLDRLLDSGESVISYDRAPAAAGLPRDVASVQGELFDLTRLAATITGHRVRGIVHAAGMPDSLLSVGMPAATVAANATGTLQLLEAGRLAGFDGRIVLLSSTRVYGDNEDAVDEHSPLHPQTPYAASKAFGDLLGQAYARSYGLDVVSLRLSEAYGPGRRLPNLLDEIIDAALAHRPLQLESGCRPPVPARPRRGCGSRRSPPHLPRLRQPAASTTSRASGCCSIRWSQSCATGCRTPTSSSAAEGSTAFDRQGPIAVTAADRELGYRPRWGLARGIDDLCAWREAQEAC